MVFFFVLANHCDHSMTFCILFCIYNYFFSRSQWSCGPRRLSAAARLPGLRFRISPKAWMSVCECCVLSGRGLCDGPIPHPEESYRVCVCVFLSVIRCNCDALHLQWVGKEGKTKKERKEELFILDNSTFFWSHAKAPTVIRRIPKSGNWVRSPVNPCGILGEQIDPGPPPPQYHSSVLLVSSFTCSITTLSPRIHHLRNWQPHQKTIKTNSLACLVIWSL